jgi:uncharacterized protein YdhG (YjbR/CyaY superfamily)
MQSKATSVEAYLAELPEERKGPMEQLREVILKNIPAGFQEGISYGMLGFVVPHSIYSPGYHCDPKLPLPFVSIASQKNAISLYHMGIYADSALLEWFINAYPKHCKSKLDMGKSCIRFKKMDQIPYALIGELMQKITVEKWIEMYEEAYIK